MKAGLQKYYPGTNLVLGGTTYTPSALQVFLQADVDANDASTVARATWLSAVTAARETDATTTPVLDAIEHVVQAQYAASANESTVMADFGYAKPNRKVLTAAEKSAAVAKAKATREARHTMGPRAKAKIKGTVVPATGAEAPQAVSPTPAPTGSSNSTSNGSPSASPGGATTTSHQ